MKALILFPALFLALAGSAQAQATTVCQAVSDNAFPIEQVSLAWGEALPDSDDSPFFRNWSQKVEVLISGPRYYRNYQAAAFHSIHNTRLGEQHSISVKLSENDRVNLTEYPEYFNSGKTKLKSAQLVLNEGTTNQKSIQLDCK